MWLLIVLTLILVACIHLLINSPYGYWKKRGIPFPKPTPLVGNVGKSVILKKTLGEIFQDIYNEYKDYRYVGIYKIRTPQILLRDPELIKDVLTKNFSSFHDNDIEADEEIDPIGSRNPFILRGNRWKVVRGQVTSNITSVKIKSMLYLIKNVGETMIEYLKNLPEATGPDGLETKELAAKYTTDVVAVCAFGLEGKSFIEPDAEFRRMGRKFLSPSFWMALKHMLIFLIPSLAAFLKIKFIPEEVEKWFINTLMETMKYRKENNIVRNDYLDMMVALKDKPGEYIFTDIDVIAQCMTFYADGFETSSVVLSFTLYEIAANPNVQAKLREEVDNILAKYGGEITYDSIQDMTYLDNVISEGLRKYPPGTALRKLCTIPYRLPPVKADGTGNGFDVPEGMCILIPVLALHYDPQYFPNPDTFDPDRFTEESKESRPKHCYLPFGDGPRQCLGLRFALAQTKAAIAAIVYNFEIKVNSKTITPIELDPTYFIPAAIGGLWLNYHKRTK